jgi:hypothetical protein
MRYSNTGVSGSPVRNNWKIRPISGFTMIRNLYLDLGIRGVIRATM